MAERFNSLYSLPDNLYFEDFPFIISAGRLLLDTQTGKTASQLKIKNLSSKNVSALKIRINCFDIAKHELGSKDFTYLDLTSTPNSEFGQKSPIYLPYSETRSFEVKFLEAVYSDGEVLNAPDGILSPVPAPESTAVFGKELADEYSHIHGEKCRFIPKKYQNIWVCSCNTVNSNEEKYCHNCHCSFESLTSDANKDTLSKKRKERLVAEEEARKEGIYQKACKKENLAESIKLLESVSGYKDADELYDKYKQEFEIKQKKSKKAKKTSAIILGVTVAIVAIALVIFFVIIPSSKYSNAEKLMNDGKYEEAISAFKLLDGYKDSNEKIDECKNIIDENKKASIYNKALLLMESEEYDEAINTFESIRYYKDSIGKTIECREKQKEKTYNEAITLMNEEKYEDAVTLFDRLENYKESVSYAIDCKRTLADICVKNGDIINAVKWFSLSGDDDSANNLRYLYVMENKNTTDRNTYSFLNALKYYNYKDAEKIFNQLYSYTVDLFVNTEHTDHSTKLTTIPYSSGGPVVHCKVNGGYPGQTCYLKLIEEKRYGYNGVASQNWEKRDSVSFELKPEDGCETVNMYSSLSNVYYWRFTVIDVQTNEKKATVTVHTPYR